MREEFAGTSQAALDFVEDEQDAVFVAAGTEVFEKARGRRGHAAFALNGFNQHRAGLRADHFRGRVEVVERAVAETSRKWLVALLVFRFGGGSDGRQCASVEGAGEAENFALLRGVVFGGILAGELDGGFVGFCPGVAEEHAVCKAVGGQFLRQMDRRFRVVEVTRVPELPGLQVQRLQQLRILMPQATHRDAAAEVEVLVALNVPDASALPSVEDHRLGCVGRHPAFAGAFRKSFGVRRCPERFRVLSVGLPLFCDRILDVEQPCVIAHAEFHEDLLADRKAHHPGQATVKLPEGGSHHRLVAKDILGQGAEFFLDQALQAGKLLFKQHGWNSGNERGWW